MCATLIPIVNCSPRKPDGVRLHPHFFYNDICVEKADSNTIVIHYQEEKGKESHNDTLSMRNGEYCTNSFPTGYVNMIVMSNSRECDTIFRAPNDPITHEISIHKKNDSIYVTSVYVHVAEGCKVTDDSPTTKNLLYQLCYDKNYDIKMINIGAVYIEYVADDKWLEILKYGHIY